MEPPCKVASHFHTTEHESSNQNFQIASTIDKVFYFNIKSNIPHKKLYGPAREL